MQKSEREYLSRLDISQRAQSMLSSLLGSKANLAYPAPLKEILAILVAEGWIEFSSDEDLGMLLGNRKVRGEFTVKPFRIRICSSIEPWSAEFRYVLAHEIGHLALHRKLIGPGKYIDRNSVPADTFQELKYRDKASLSDLGWVEWQANEFAAALVLPFPFLLLEVCNKQKERGILNNIGVLYYDDQPGNQVECTLIIRELALLHGITEDLLWSRLRSLNILQDHRKKKVAVAYECLEGLFYTDSIPASKANKRRTPMKVDQ